MHLRETKKAQASLDQSKVVIFIDSATEQVQFRVIESECTWERQCGSEWVGASEKDQVLRGQTQEARHHERSPIKLQLKFLVLRLENTCHLRNQRHGTCSMTWVISPWAKHRLPGLENHIDILRPQMRKHVNTSWTSSPHFESNLTVDIADKSMVVLINTLNDTVPRAGLLRLSPFSTVLTFHLCSCSCSQPAF